MGSAIIKSHLGAGQYSIELVKSEAKALARKTAIDARQIVVDAAIAAKEAEVVTAQATLAAKIAALSAAVTAMTTDPKTVEAVNTAQKEQIAAEAAVAARRCELGKYKLEKISLAKELTQINAALVKETVNAWCADYSLLLTGTIGTIEVNGEASQILVMPGGAVGAGLLQHPLAETPAGVFVNQAKLPAWQKWKPTYRIGTITALTGDACDVALKPALSSQQNLNINQAETLANVPIVYMQIHGLAFVVGDSVVVKFDGQAQASPKVVGFESNPRRLGSYLFVYCFDESLGEAARIYDVSTDGLTLRYLVPLSKFTELLTLSEGGYTGGNIFLRIFEAAWAHSGQVYWNYTDPASSVVAVRWDPGADGRVVNYLFPPAPTGTPYTIVDAGSGIPTLRVPVGSSDKLFFQDAFQSAFSNFPSTLNHGLSLTAAELIRQAQLLIWRQLGVAIKVDYETYPGGSYTENCSSYFSYQWVNPLTYSIPAESVDAWNAQFNAMAALEEARLEQWWSVTGRDDTAFIEAVGGGQVTVGCYFRLTRQVPIAGYRYTMKLLNLDGGVVSTTILPASGRIHELCSGNIAAWGS